jgi:hypothetical protein
MSSNSEQIAIAIFYIIVNAILSSVVAEIAQKRGKSFAAFFWLSFLFSCVIALLLLLAMGGGISDNRTENAEEIRVKCAHCAEPILAEARVCKHCGREVEPQLSLLETAKLELAKSENEARLNAIQVADAIKRQDRKDLAYACFLIGGFTLICSFGTVGSGLVYICGTITAITVGLGWFLLAKPRGGSRGSARD